MEVDSRTVPIFTSREQLEAYVTRGVYPVRTNQEENVPSTYNMHREKYNRAIRKNVIDVSTYNSNKRKAQPNDGSRGKKTKYGNIDTVQHEKQKRHTRKRKRTPTEERSIGNSEEDQNNTSDKNNKEEESAEGKRKYKRKKPKNKRARCQQISDSSDSSDMNDDSDNDSMNDQTREEQAENRKGVG